MKLSLFAAALFTGAVSAADTKNESTKSDVVVLTGDSFAEFVSENPLALIEFYAPWCGHCKNLAPEYEKAATALKDDKIALAKVDCTENQDLCSGFDIVGYPTLKVFRGEDKYTDFRGGRNADSIVETMKRQNTPLLTDITAKNVEEITGSTDFSVVAFLDKKQNELLEMFKDTAESFRERIRSGLSNDKKLAAKYGAELGQLVMFKKGEEPVVFSSEFTPESLKKFLNTESFASFGDLSPQNFPSYVESGIPLFYAFVTTEAEKAEIREKLTPMLKELKGAANIVFLNGTVFGSHAEVLGLKPEFPALLIHDMTGNLKYPHSQTEDITVESVSKFVKSFLAGELKPKLKSAPIPEEQTGPVYILVAEEFDDVVYKSGNDVFIEFYAPWCGHCKNLAPTYDKLGAMFADNDKIVIAKVDHTENEVPMNIQSYPTLFFFAAGQKEPIPYHGTRSLEDMAKFVQEHSVNKVDIEGALNRLADESVEFEDEEAVHEEL